MNEKRFFYNPFNNTLHNCGYVSHSVYFHNVKLSGRFDDYIRGIIKDNILYLRAYYPYKDIDNLSYDELIQKSSRLLIIYKADVIKALTKEGIKINDTKISVTNIKLKEYLQKQYV